MDMLFILDSICMIILSIFSFYYLKKLIKNEADIEMTDKSGFYEEFIKWGILSTIPSMFFKLKIINKIEEFYIGSFFLTLIILIIITILAVLIMICVINKKKYIIHYNNQYRKIKRKAVIRYFIIMSISIFIMYPILHFGVYFLTK